MNKYIVALFALLLSSCVSGMDYRQASVNLLEASLDATVALGRPDGRVFCSGVLHRSLVLTAAHCVTDSGGGAANMDNIRLFLRGQEEASEGIPVEVLRVDGGRDFAILRATDRVLPYGVALAPAAPMYADPVVVIGHPYGLRWSVVNGLVSHPRREGGPTPDMVWVQLSSPLSPGNSGGPVFNQHGEVVGIASFRVDDAHLAGAVHWEVIRNTVAETTQE